MARLLYQPVEHVRNRNADQRTKHRDEYVARLSAGKHDPGGTQSPEYRKVNEIQGVRDGTKRRQPGPGTPVKPRSDPWRSQPKQEDADVESCPPILLGHRMLHLKLRIN